MYCLTGAPSTVGVVTTSIIHSFIGGYRGNTTRDPALKLVGQHPHEHEAPTTSHPPGWRYSDCEASPASLIG